MTDEQPRRYLVEWTERVTYKDVAYLTDEQAMTLAGVVATTWESWSEEDRSAAMRAVLNELVAPEGFAGTLRMRVVDRSDFDVLGSARWPRDEAEPTL